MASEQGPRYIIELHLIEVDEKGNQVMMHDIQTTPDVTDSLVSMTASMEWLRECLGNALYDHEDGFEKLTPRYFNYKKEE